MNKLLSIIFLIFGLLFLLNLGYSAVTCTYISADYGSYGRYGYNPAHLRCDITLPKKVDNTLKLDSYNNIPNNLVRIYFNNPTILNLENNLKDNLNYEFYQTYNTNASSVILINQENYNYNLYYKDIIANTQPTINSKTISNLKLDNSKVTFNTENTITNINLTNNSNLILPKNNIIQKLIIQNSTLTSDKPQIINDLNIFNSTNQNISLTIPLQKINAPFVKLNNVSRSNFNFNFNKNSDINNILNSILIKNSQDITINGFDYNKIDELNLTQPTSMLTIKDSDNITIQGFRLYSEKGITNNNLVYLDLNNNSRIIITNNVFNDVNYPIITRNSINYIYSNSIYNVNSVFNYNNLYNSKIIFFNNFLKTIENLSNLNNISEYQLSVDENRSFGPVIDSKNYSCSEDDVTYLIFFSSEDDRNMPIYYYDPKTKSYVSYIYTPQCIGGNLYANKAIPNICGKNCFLFLLEGKNSKPDLIWDFSLKTKYTDIWDNAPLMFPLENYSDFVYETSDEYLSISFEIKNKEEIYLKDDNINFLVRIKPLPISVEGGFWSWLGSGNITFTFKDILINDKITISIDETVNANAFLNCTKAFCREVDNVEYNFEIVFDDLNFELIKFEKISTGNENIEFKLNYDYNEITGMCEILNSLLENCNTTYCSEQEKNDILEHLPQWCILKELSISQIIPLNVEGSAPTIKTPDNNVWVIMLLCISIMGIYLFGNRKKEFKCK